ncbi:hypothetical protein [Streptomyces sp. NPDC003036]|uniref:hypothetical protein n=1 Tax=Streptomyces sp. NPDC003036 TaxID=3154442 RepID=UPI0033AACE91
MALVGLGNGDQVYKQTFVTDSLGLPHVVLARHTPRAAGYLVHDVAMRRTRDFITARPRPRAFVREGLRRYGRLRERHLGSPP